MTYGPLDPAGTRPNWRDEEGAGLVRTVSNAAALLGVSRALAYRLVKTGRLRHMRLGRRVVVPYRAIQDLVEGLRARTRRLWRVSPRHVPTKEQASQAVDRLLAALETGSDIFDALDDIRVLHPKSNTFPGEIFMRLAADALDEGGVRRDHPIDEEGLIERYLSQCEFRGRDNHKIRYAVLVAAATHAGVEVDLLEEVVYWGTDDFWSYAGFAAAAWIRAVADQRAIALGDLCGRLRARSGIQAIEG